MPVIPDRHRRSIRLTGYDYAQPGAYYVTLVAQGRELIFGEMKDGEVVLTTAGDMLHSAWLALPGRFPHIELDDFIIMPNHLHGIIILRPDDQPNPVGATLVVAPPDRAETSPAPTAGHHTPTLGDIIGAFKSITTHEYVLGVRQNKWPPFNQRLWQRNYYEHILRSPADLDQVRAYIRANPLQWAQDLENPAVNKKRS